MKIGFFTTSFPRYEGDLAGSFVFGMARAFSRKGHSVKVFAPNPPHYKGSLSNMGWLEGMELIHMPYAWPRGLGKLFYGVGVPDNVSANPFLLGHVPAALASFVYHFRKHSSSLDSIISHWLIPSALIVGLFRRPGVSHLAISHSSDIHLLKKLPFSRGLAGIISESADHLGFVTSRLRKEFLSLISSDNRDEIGNRTSVTPMGVDLDELKSERKRSQVRSELGLKSFTVLFLGRLVPIKGVDFLISALAGTADVELIVAGDGPMRPALEARALQSGVRARFLGEVGPGRRAELFSACDAVAVPSRMLPNGRQEGLPLVLIEALGAGCPVVTTTVADTEKMVEDGNCGFVVPTGDVKGFSKALSILRDDEVLVKRLGRNGMTRAKSRDWSRLVDKLEALVTPSIF